MLYTIESAQSIFPSTQIANVVPDTIASFDKLNAEDQLALIWFAYTEIPGSGGKRTISKIETNIAVDNKIFEVDEGVF